MTLSFDNLKVAFANKSTKELKFSYLIFKMFSYPWLVKFFSRLTIFCLKINLPISWFIKATVFKQFCGGESIAECSKVINQLGSYNIDAILDYSVEGEQNEKDFNHTKNEIIKVIHTAKNNKNIPVGCIKLTGIIPISLLQKITEEGMETINDKEKIIYNNGVNRLQEICEVCINSDVPIYIDAEETWIQDAIDRISEEMIFKYNTNKAIVFTTIQMYRWDRLDYFKKLVEEAKLKKIKVGIKIVRGAYIEKENERAKEKGYKTPMQPNKQSTDRDYDLAIEYSVKNIDTVELCAATHNEESSIKLAELMHNYSIEKNDKRIYFSQLFGMSDNMSFNLAINKYNVSKYLPYGPVKSTIPYLIRRAEENTSIAGQLGKEIQLIKKELGRRN